MAKKFNRLQKTRSDNCVHQERMHFGGINERFFFFFVYSIIFFFRIFTLFCCSLVHILYISFFRHTSFCLCNIIKKAVATLLHTL